MITLTEEEYKEILDIFAKCLVAFGDNAVNIRALSNGACDWEATKYMLSLKTNDIDPNKQCEESFYALQKIIPKMKERLRGNNYFEGDEKSLYEDLE